MRVTFNSILGEIYCHVQRIEFCFSDRRQKQVGRNSNYKNGRAIPTKETVMCGNRDKLSKVEFENALLGI